MPSSRKYPESNIEQHAFIIATALYTAKQGLRRFTLTEKVNAHFSPNTWTRARVRGALSTFMNSEQDVQVLLDHAQTRPWYDQFRNKTAQMTFDKNWSELKARWRNNKVTENWNEALNAKGGETAEEPQLGTKRKATEKEALEAEEDREKAREEGEAIKEVANEVTEEGGEAKEAREEAKEEREKLKNLKKRLDNVERMLKKKESRPKEGKKRLKRSRS
ncbi:MAG: hypothetical protein Q9167_006807 [Letrouitia subvulpina]